MGQLPRKIFYATVQSWAELQDDFVDAARLKDGIEPVAVDAPIARMTLHRPDPQSSQNGDAVPIDAPW